jgi:hypothetical protein
VASYFLSKASKFGKLGRFRLLFVKRLIGFRKRMPRRLHFDLFLLAQDIKLPMIVGKIFGISIETGFIEQNLKLVGQKRSIARLDIYPPSVHDFLR